MSPYPTIGGPMHRPMPNDHDDLAHASMLAIAAAEKLTDGELADRLEDVVVPKLAAMTEAEALVFEAAARLREE